MHREEPFNIENILNECIESIHNSDKTVEDCLNDYPEHAGELEPLLRMFSQSKKASMVEPREEFRSRARYEFYSAVDEICDRRKSPWFKISTKWMQVAVSALVGLMVTGGGVIAASGDTLPGQPLYSVKMMTEQVRMGLTFSEAGRTELNAELAERRIDEIIALADEGQADLISETTNRLNVNLMRLSEGDVDFRTTEASSVLNENLPGIVSYPPEDGVMPGHIDSFTVNPGDSQQVISLKEKAAEGYSNLVAKLNQAPEDCRPALEEALAVLIQGYEAAIEDAG